MKPSFAEEIEGYVSSEESFKGEYGFLILNGSGSTIRRQRVERLKQLSWQLIYLSCFIEVVEHKFADEAFPSQEEKLRFFASAYNSGFNQSAAQIKSKIKNRTFPNGPKFGNEQHCYAEVSLEFFNQLDNGDN